MLFYNVGSSEPSDSVTCINLSLYEMSNTTTPTRPGRGITVPGIDTRSLDEKAVGPGYFHGLPLTPPQSANESRRPSLAYSSFSDASNSGPSSIAGYSQPPTPVNSMNQSTDHFPHQWSDGSDVQTNMANAFNGACSFGQIQPLYNASFHQQAMCGVQKNEHALSYPQVGSNNHIALGSHANHMTPARNDAWHQQQASMDFDMANSGLKTTLFQSPHGIGPEAVSAAMYANPPASLPGSLEQSVSPNHSTSAPVVMSSMFHVPPTVVPSQLSPHDEYHMEQCPDEEMSNDYNRSFESTGTTYSNWEMVGSQYSDAAYFDHSSEEDYIMVKDEMPRTPSRLSSVRSHRDGVVPDHSPHRIKRRSSKRARKSHANGKIWYEEEFADCHVSYEGKPFVIAADADGQVMVIPENCKESKPHKCAFLKDDGEPCGAAFHRSEHLKRHMTSHSKEKPYFCVVPGCNKRFNRPDNTGDHYGSHMSTSVKGRRNNHCSFADLKQFIADSDMSEKHAKKLVTNLEKRQKKQHDAAREKEREKMRHGGPKL